MVEWVISLQLFLVLETTFCNSSLKIYVLVGEEKEKTHSNILSFFLLMELVSYASWGLVIW